MSGSVLGLFVAMVGVAVVLYLLVADRRRERVQKLRVKKLYASPLFDAMKPLIHRAQKYPLESLSLDKTGFTIRYVFPMGYENHFVLHDYGFPNLTPEKQEALLLLLEGLLPKLSEHSCYSFRSVRTKLLDGHVEYQYKYVIRIDYKNLLTRAPYYDGTVQSQVW